MANADWRMTDCPVCDGTGWVCEAHPDKAWPHECDCAPGKPCKCNKATPPADILSWTVADWLCVGVDWTKGTTDSLDGLAGLISEDDPHDATPYLRSYSHWGLH